MIAIGSDHAGFELKQVIMKHLEERNLEFKDYGTYSSDSCDYAVYAEKTARAVVDGECEIGLLFCGTGVGISIAANKVKGIRACCCSDLFSAEMTRLHNNANLLCSNRVRCRASLCLSQANGHSCRQDNTRLCRDAWCYRAQFR